MDATHDAKADIEAIKQLKADYFRLLDSKQWRAWGELFTEDALLDSSDDSPDGVARGREAIVGMVSGALEGAVRAACCPVDLPPSYLACGLPSGWPACW